MASRSKSGTSSTWLAEPFRLAGLDVLLERFRLADRMFLKLLLSLNPLLGVGGGDSTSVARSSSVLTVMAGRDWELSLRALRLPILRNSLAILSRAEPAGLFNVTVSSSSVVLWRLLSFEACLEWVLTLLLVLVLGRVTWLWPELRLEMYPLLLPNDIPESTFLFCSSSAWWENVGLVGEIDRPVTSRHSSIIIFAWTR